MKKTISVKYDAGHTIETTWIKGDLYCPNCGNKGIWVEDDGGDYYVGEAHLCTNCEYSFHLPCSGPCGKDYLDAQRISQLIKVVL